MNEINLIMKQAKETLRSNGIDEREARLLLAFALGVNANDLIKYTECSEEAAEKFREVLQKRVSGMPYAYITGTKEFMKLNFKVNENVLIPRPETELLVEEALKCDAKDVLDMCTGSGCIAISMAYYQKGANVTAVDISEKALEVAKENADMNGVCVNFVQSDLFEKVSGKFDLILSNPTYIKTAVISELSKEVKNEPQLALDGGESGLAFYEKIATEARDFLKENGKILLEIGFDQGQGVKEILEKNDYKNIEIIKDLSGNDRIIVCEM